MSETKKCAQCGRELPIEDFSKSYRKLCRECVANNEKLKRTEMLYVKSQAPCNRVEIHGDVQFVPSPRMTIATAAMQGILSNPHPQMAEMSVDKVVNLAVKCADSLLEKLSTKIA